MPGPTLILASRSPRRRELLALAGIDHLSVDPDIDEASDGGEPAEIVVMNALAKARAGRDGATLELPALGADTEVAVEGRVLGKAKDEREARRSLLALAGRSHEVLTGVAVATPEGRELTGVARTVVTMSDLDEGDELLARYLASGEWRDRAGAYAVQGLGSALIESIDGGLDNVIGLPLELVLELLARADGPR